MNWKKIAALALLLAALTIAIVYVNQREKGKRAVEGILVDIPAASIDRIELRNRAVRLSFSRRDLLWQMDAPLTAKADKTALEGILDNFCRLKYDRLVAESAARLEDFGLDKPEIELKLSAQGRLAATILLGMKNAIDDSSYARLAGENRVVQIASYMRNGLEKDPFAFRDKKVLDLDIAAIHALEFRREGSALDFAKTEGRWFLKTPVYSRAHESKIGDILAAAAALEALSFAPAPGQNTLGEFGLDKPVLVAEFRSLSGSRRLMVGRKNETVYALAGGASEICVINKDFLDRFEADPAPFREKKVAPFFAFDVSEIVFLQEGFRFTARKNAAGTWNLDKEVPGKKPSPDKIESLLSSLADLEAREFIDGAKVLPRFPTRIAIKTEDPAGQGKPAVIVIELSAAEEEMAIARNPSLPYQFRVGKEILDKLPAKLDDLCEEAATAPAPGS